MNYKIVAKDSFTVLERIEQHTVARNQNKNTIPDFWDRAHNDGTIQTLLDHSSDNSFVFGICYGNGHTDCEKFNYGIAVQCAPDSAAPEGFRVNRIPARTWAIFECVGVMPDAIQALWHEICSEFFPTSSFEPTYEMDIEAYPDGDMIDSDYRSQIWVPIKSKYTS